MATLTVKPSNTLKIKTQRVKKAYLAKKEIKGTEKTGETESYTFKGSNNTSTKARKEKIATIIYKNIKGGLQKKQQQTTVAHIVEVLKKDSYTKGDCIDIPLTLPKIEFTKLANANLGDEVYMVVETENMANKRIKLSLKQAEKDCLVAKDSSIVLQQDGKKTSVVETYVSRFTEQNKKNISNAEDFRNFAIDAVTLSPKEEKDQKKYREALNKTTDKKTKLFMVVDAEPVGASWKEVFYDEVFDLTPNQWYYGEKNWFELKSKSVIEIGIYHTGHIDKVELKDAEKVKYVYHDKNNKQHIICTCNLLEIDERLKGSSDDSKTKHSVETGYDKNNIVTYSHDSSRKKYVYPDGTIRTYGKFYNPDKKTNYRLVTYKKGTGKKYIVKMPDSLNIKLRDKSIIYSFTGTARRYCGPEHFACFIGALAEEGYTLKSGGACEEDGTCYPSVSHINGQSVDTSYLDDTKEQKFINAMYKFGFLTQLRGKDKKKFIHTSDGGKLHNNHLHSGGLKPNYK